MQLKEFNIILDIKKHIQQEQFEVVQGDSFTNLVNISLVDGLNAYDLSNTNVEIVFRKSDGTTVLQSDIAVINAIQGKIQCTLKTNTIASPGKVLAEVRVLNIDKLLTSTRFEFFVRQSLVNDEAIESTNEFPILTQLINEVRQIEAQVPEEVINNLNALTDYVDSLAGLGRTTETIKGNADGLAALLNSHNEHKAETVTQTIYLTRDISLLGTQSVVTGKNKPIKSLIIYATIPNSKSTCITSWSDSGSNALYQDGTTGNSFMGGNITISKDGTTNRTVGTITNFTNAGFDINWSILSGAGVTGTAGIAILVQYHGGA